MSNIQQSTAPKNNTPQSSQSSPSALDRFTLSFEYDRTIQEIRRDVRHRTI